MRWRLSESPWAKRIAKYSFLFFLIKGLLWLIVPALIAYIYSSE